MFDREKSSLVGAYKHEYKTCFTIPPNTNLFSFRSLIQLFSDMYTLLLVIKYFPFRFYSSLFFYVFRPLLYVCMYTVYISKGKHRNFYCFPSVSF